MTVEMSVSIISKISADVWSEELRFTCMQMGRCKDDECHDGIRVSVQHVMKCLDHCVIELYLRALSDVHKMVTKRV